MGRAVDGQHRSFIELCLRDGWWKTFVHVPPDERPDAWIQVLEEFARDQADTQRFSQWMRYFADFYRFSRWMREYAGIFLTLPLRSNISLKTALRPMADPLLSFGGWSAPAIDRSVGIGGCFIVREIARLKVIDGGPVERHCWIPRGRVRRLLTRLGCERLEGPSDIDQSTVIADFVARHLGTRGIDFCGDYDLPLQIVTRDKHAGALSDMLGQNWSPSDAGFDSEPDTPI